MSVDRHTFIPASYVALVNEEGEVLLVERKNTSFREGWFSLVAGHVDPGETCTEAMIREAKEEVGIDIDPKDIELVCVYQRNMDDPSNTRIDFVYRCARWNGTPHNADVDDKIGEMRWCALDALPKDTIPFVRHALARMYDPLQYIAYEGEG
jgi:8-oxo-dGTP pyrophosphatase MutT (NUDIX family)